MAKKRVKENIIEKAGEKIKEIKKVKEVKELKESSEVKIAGIWSKLKNLLFNGEKFLNSVENEKKFWSVFSTFIVVFLAYYIIGSVMDQIFNKLAFLDFLYNLLVGFIISIITAIIYPLLVSFIFHLSVLLFRGKEKFFFTFKSATYALVLGYIYSFIMLFVTAGIQIFGAIDFSMFKDATESQSFDLFIQAFKELASTSQGLLFIIAVIVIFTISLIHQFIFLTKSLSKFQKLTKLKAALSTIVSILIFSILSYVFYGILSIFL